MNEIAREMLRELEGLQIELLRRGDMREKGPCKICDPLDHTIYRLGDDIPQPPFHRHCKCYFEAR